MTAPAPCDYTDNADVGFDPGDTTQMRLSYASGPFSVALRRSKTAQRATATPRYNGHTRSYNQLGAAGRRDQVFQRNTFSGEISAGVDRGTSNGVGEDVEVRRQHRWPDGRWAPVSGSTLAIWPAELVAVVAMGQGPFELGQQRRSDRRRPADLQ